MRAMKLLTFFIALLFALAPASRTFADISNAAVLYLRIAPGARAAAMGEAYVAIADDATATHWNPAGLGSYPLAGTWRESNVPSVFAPLTSIASLRARGGSNYMAYDVWAVTPKGLVRYDNKDWYQYEVFSTRTDQTVEKIASSYFNITDADKLSRVVKRIAIDNNPKGYDYLEQLKQTVLGSVKEGYTGADALKAGFDSLLSAYDQCLVNWNYVGQVEDLYKTGMKDSSLTETETDRISFAVERSRNHFIPEELHIYYSTLFDATPTTLASTEQYLAVGTDSGLYVYDGKRWKGFGAADGLPSNHVLTLSSASGSIYAGTDSGLVKIDGMRIVAVRPETGFPAGVVTAVGGTTANNVWAVVNGQLYHFDGNTWSNGHKYTVVLDDTPEVLATKFALYGTPDERAKFLEMLTAMNPPKARVATPDSTSADSTGSTPVANSDTMTAASPGGEPVSPSALAFEAGQEIMVPYVAELKGDIKVIEPDDAGRLWIGTSYGILRFDGSRWSMPGYKTVTVGENQTLDSLVAMSAMRLPMKEDQYRQSLILINGLTDGSVTPGQNVLVYQNPAAVSINYVAASSNTVYFGSDDGVIVFDGNRWGKLDQSGFDHAKTISVEAVGDELWLASDQEIVAKANGRTDISLMYVKWLPDLADDLYYTFASLVTNKQGLGTFGGNLTFISYGTIVRTNEQNVDLGSFDAFDMAVTGSYGGSLTSKLKGGISAKLLYSKLAEQGAGQEKGKGTSTGFALDFGLMYHWTPRLTLGMAVTNLGPDMAYIDAAQSDPLPRNLALGFAYKLMQTDYTHFLVTAEMNKSLVGINDGLKEEFKQVVFNGGGEFMYANLLALRGGYIYDQEGAIKTVTLGIGLAPLSSLKFDFSYIPSNTSSALANTLRISLSILP